MRTLVLLRHAQAAPGAPDHERPLDATGRVEAEDAGARIAQAGLRPTLALVSGARRTRETFAAVAGVLGPVREIVEPRLYDARSEEVIALARGAPEPHACLLVIGHNPGLGDAARLLAAEGSAEDLTVLQHRFPTGAAAILDLEIVHWADLAAGGRLRGLLLPGG